jgi:hypothetical protein
MKKCLVVVLACILSACATSRGFDRGALRTEIGGQRTVTEDDIRKALELKAQLPRPFKLAVYFSTSKNRPYYYGGGRWEWLGDDKDKFITALSPLRTQGVLSDLFVISDATLEGTDNRAIRLAAARAGADAVLIINGISDVDRYNNALGATYALLVTPFFVPGTVADGLFMVNAALWDVGNQYLYLSAEAEGTARQTEPAFYINEEHIVRDAKIVALDALAKEMLPRLQRMDGK